MIFFANIGFMLLQNELGLLGRNIYLWEE